jgi:hypothetical protein
MGIVEGEEVQAKGISNILKKNYTRKFPKSQDRDTHASRGSHQYTKQT